MSKDQITPISTEKYNAKRVINIIKNIIGYSHCNYPQKQLESFSL